ncbi:thiolase family protein, partial [Enterococcus faecium]
MWNTAIGWRMTNPALPKHWTISNGESAEKIAREWGITREAQDAFAVRSHQRAAAAWAAGVFDGEIVPVPGVALSRD